MDNEEQLGTMIGDQIITVAFSHRLFQHSESDKLGNYKMPSPQYNLFFSPPLGPVQDRWEYSSFILNLSPNSGCPILLYLKRRLNQTLLRNFKSWIFIGTSTTFVLSNLSMSHHSTHSIHLSPFLLPSLQHPRGCSNMS